MKKSLAIVSVLLVASFVAQANRGGRAERPVHGNERVRTEEARRDKVVLKTSEKDMTAEDVANRLLEIEQLAQGKEWEANFVSFRDQVATKMSEEDYAGAQALIAQIGARAGLKPKDGKSVEEQVLNCK